MAVLPVGHYRATVATPFETRKPKSRVSDYNIAAITPPMPTLIDRQSVAVDNAMTMVMTCWSIRNIQQDFPMGIKNVE